MEKTHNLLTEELLSWRHSGRNDIECTLPGLLAALSADEVTSFPRARAHQQDPWAMFLIQLAVIALRRGQSSGAPELLPTSEDTWRAMLLNLTHGAHEPWCLVVEDLAKPAFLQPPVPEGALEQPGKNPKPWKTKTTPDELDILVTSKNHDVKSHLVGAPHPEHWVLALCTLQTMQGYPGRGYAGICRMNGGYGNRPRVRVAETRAVCGSVRRDIEVMLDSWPDLLNRGYSEDGVGLAWCEAWDGTASLTVADLCPHFIEVCWRARLTGSSSSDPIRAHYTTVRGRRCAPEVDGGDVGDPWIPVDRESGKALTVGSAGYSYKLLAELLLGAQYAPAAAQLLRPGDPARMVLRATALARGQGKTEGLHERVLPISAVVRRHLSSPIDKEQLAARAKDWIKQAAKMRSKVLFPALKQLALGEDAPPDRLDARIDECFFPSLFAAIGEPNNLAQARWDDKLLALAHRELDRVMEGTVLSDARYWRTISAAYSMFFGCLKKAFPDAYARHFANHKTPSSTSSGT